eukprot:1525694-Pleurochrysis_carterae.AAC.1
MPRRVGRVEGCACRPTRQLRLAPSSAALELHLLTAALHAWQAAIAASVPQTASRSATPTRMKTFPNRLQQPTASVSRARSPLVST